MNLGELVFWMNGFGTNLSRPPSHLSDLNGVSSGITKLLACVVASPPIRALASFSSVSGSSPMPAVTDWGGELESIDVPVSPSVGRRTLLLLLLLLSVCRMDCCC